MFVSNDNYEAIKAAGFEFYESLMTCRGVRIFAAKRDHAIPHPSGFLKLTQNYLIKDEKFIVDLDFFIRGNPLAGREHRKHFLNGLMKFSRAGSEEDTIMQQMIDELPELAAERERLRLARSIPALPAAPTHAAPRSTSKRL